MNHVMTSVLLETLQRFPFIFQLNTFDGKDDQNEATSEEVVRVCKILNDLYRSADGMLFNICLYVWINYLTRLAQPIEVAIKVLF